MNTIASRFLSFEETLGAGLVKFAYFVLLAVLVVATVVGVIGGVVALFTVGVWAGLGQVFGSLLWFVIGIILLRVATEVVLAILSIDDQLTDGARNEGSLPLPSSGSGGGLPKNPDTSVTEASKEENQRAPFTRTGDPEGGGRERTGGTSVADKAADKLDLPKSPDTAETEASKPENQKAPFTESDAPKPSGGAKSVGTAPAKKAPAKKATKKTATKKTTTSAEKTAEAARAATRPSASTSDEKGD